MWGWFGGGTDPTANQNQNDEQLELNKSPTSHESSHIHVHRVQYEEDDESDIEESRDQQFNKAFLNFAKQYSEKNQNRNTTSLGRSPNKIFSEDEYQYFLGIKYQTPSQINRHFSSYTEELLDSAEESEYDGETASGGEEPDITGLNTPHKIRRNPVAQLQTIKSFNKYNIEDGEYNERVGELSQNSAEYFNNSQSKTVVHDTFFDPQSGKFRRIPRDADGNILWGKLEHMDSEDETPNNGNNNNSDDDPTIGADGFYRFDLDERLKRQQEEGALHGGRSDMDHLSAVAGYGGAAGFRPSTKDLEKMYHPLGRDYDTLPPQEQYRRLMDYVFEPVIEDPETFFRIMEKDKLKEMEKENPELKLENRLKKEKERIKRNIEQHKAWYQERFEELKAREMSGGYVAQWEWNELNKKQDFLEYKPEDFDPDDHIDYRQKYQQRILDTTYLDPDFASDLVGVGRRRKVINPFYARYHDPQLLADEKIPQGTEPRWVTYRDDGPWDPETQRQIDALYTDPYDIVHERPLTEEQRRVLNEGKEEQTIIDPQSGVEIKAVIKIPIQQPTEDDGGDGDDNLGYDGYRNRPVNSRSKRNGNNNNDKHYTLDVGLLSFNPKRTQIDPNQPIGTDPVDLLTQPLFYQYNKKNVVSQEKFQQQKQKTLQDDRAIEDEIRAIADRKLEERNQNKRSWEQ